MTSTRPIEQLLREITDPLRNEVLGQYVTKRVHHLKSSGMDPATITAHTLNELQVKWDDLHKRMEIVPGKQVLARLNQLLEQELGISITMRGIISQMKKEDIPGDLAGLLGDLESFRKIKS